MTNATWKKNPGSNDFNTATNWTPAVVPDGTATFGASSVRDLIIPDGAVVRGWTLNAQAGTYTFLQGVGHSLEFDGAGIAIQHGSATVTDDGSIFFDNSSSAGKAHITVNAADAELVFNDNSNAGSAVITANGETAFAGTASAAKAHFTVNDVLAFEVSSKAASSTIFVNAAGEVDFGASSSAGNAVITDNGFISFVGSATAANAHFTANDDGLVQFDETSNAGNAHFTVNDDGKLEFEGPSKAGSATIAVNAGGKVQFFATSSGDHATITVQSGGELDIASSSNAGDATINNAGEVFFGNRGTGGDAKLMGSGTFDFSGTLGPNSDHIVYAGSIQGAGTYDLGGNELILISNRSTKVTGLIADGGVGGGTVGDIVKQGTGTLTLAHQDNTYTGDTVIERGTLDVAAKGAAGTAFITFVTGDKATLKIENAALDNHAFDGGEVHGVAGGDVLDFAGLKFVQGAKATLDNTEVLSVKSGHVTDTVSLFDPGVTTFQVKSDGHGGTKVVAVGSLEKPLHEAHLDAEHGATDAALDPLHLGL